MLVQLLKHGMLAPNAFVVLHDTGLHPLQNDLYIGNLASEHKKIAIPLHNDSNHRFGIAHQPVERLIVLWLRKYDCKGDWQYIAAHDDDARGAVGVRHGVTIMQRRVSMEVPRAYCDAKGQMGFRGERPSGGAAECLEIQSNPNYCRS